MFTVGIPQGVSGAGNAGERRLTDRRALAFDSNVLARHHWKMKYKIDKPLEFKSSFIEALIAEWNARAENIEGEFAVKIEAARDWKKEFEVFSEKEQLEQDCRVQVSEIKTAAQILKAALDRGPLSAGKEEVQILSLFDVSTVSGSAAKIVTFLVLPLETLPTGLKKQLSVEGKSINILPSKHWLIGKKQGFEWSSEGGPIFEELHMGHWASTASTAKAFQSKISFFYDS